MGYYADAKGFIVAKDTNSYQKLEEMLGYGLATNDTPFNFRKDTSTLTFKLNNTDDYWDDEVTNFLRRISELTCEGEVDYVGDGHELWRFVFDPDTVNWKKENGYVTYGKPSLSDVSDGDLIIELEKRGYVVRDL